MMRNLKRYLISMALCAILSVSIYKTTFAEDYLNFQTSNSVTIQTAQDTMPPEFKEQYEYNQKKFNEIKEEVDKKHAEIKEKVEQQKEISKSPQEIHKEAETIRSISNTALIIGIILGLALIILIILLIILIIKKIKKQ